MTTVSPIDYHIKIEPDLTNFTFKGTLQATFRASAPVDTISLNTLELSLHQCRVLHQGKHRECKIEPIAEEQISQIQLPQPCGGEFRLQIEYSGEINDKMAGFYRSHYPANNGRGTLTLTQFQESDARRAFPCVDHPAQKAVFHIELIVDENLTAISNTALTKEEALDQGKKRVCFKATPKMSTYLVFFAVGKYELLTDPLDPRMRAAFRPGMSSHARFGLSFGRKALGYCENYYAIPYPLDKMDLIAIPDFAFGAMENWGAITFRENLLLHFPETTSGFDEERICEVIAHEIVHQWFGNLVTPVDWKYLWLNESFATYSAYGVVDHYQPEWQIWHQFLTGQTTAAMERDALPGTHAIEIPGTENVAINSSTAPIIYSKGGSVLRQVEGYIGPDNFQSGLHKYLSRHAYDCAASHDLWEALEAAASLPVTQMMENWIDQPGHPLLTVQREGQALVIEQRRFSYLPRDTDQKWIVPLCIHTLKKDGTVYEIKQLMTERNRKIDIGADTAAYVLNPDRRGFFRVRYNDRANLDALGQALQQGRLPVEARWGIESDLFALLKAGLVDCDAYLEFLTYYGNETAPLPLSGIMEHLFMLYLLGNDDRRLNTRTLAMGLVDNFINRFGTQPQTDDTHGIARVRDLALWHGVIHGHTTAREACQTQFTRYQRGEPIPSDLLPSTAKTGAFTGDETTFQWLRKRLAGTESEPERMVLLSALGHFRQWSVMTGVLEFVLQEVPDRNRFIPIAAAGTNPHAVPHLWDWFVAHEETLLQMHPLLYERVLTGLVPTGGLIDPAGVTSFFDGYLERHPRHKDVVTLSLEKLRVLERLQRAVT